MAKTVQVIVDVNSNSVQIASDKTLTLTQQVRELKKALQTVPEGTAEWTLIQQKYNETKDSLDRVNVKSKELFGTMSSLPGPIGQVAGSLDNTIGVLKTFTGIKLSDVKTQFVELLKDVKAIGVGLLEVTGVTKVYTMVTKAMTVAEAEATVATRVLAGAVATLYAALGLGLIALLVMGAKTLYDWASGAGEAEAANDALSRSFIRLQKAAQDTQDVIADETKLLVTQAKTRGEHADKLYEIEKNGLDKSLQANKDYRQKLLSQEYQLELNQAISDEDKLARRKEIEAEITKSNDQDYKIRTAQIQLAADRELDIADKGRERNTKNAQTAASDLKTIAKNIQQAGYALLTDRQAAVQKVYDSYQEQINLAKKYGEDTAVLEAARRKEIEKINEKYNEDDYKLQKAFRDRLDEIDLAANDNKEVREYETRRNKLARDLRDLEEDKEFIKLSEDQKEFYRQQLRDAAQIELDEKDREARIRGYDDEIMLLEAQQKTLTAGTQAYLDNALKIEDTAYKRKIDAAKGNAKQIEAIKKEHEQNIKNINLQAYIAEKQIALERIAVIGSIGTSLGQLAGKNKELAIAAIIVSKAAAIGEIIVNTQIANAKALAASPLTFGQPWVAINYVAMGLAIAASVAAGAQAISDINSAPGPAASAGGGAGGGGGQPPTPAFNGTVEVPAPVIGASQANPSGNLGQTIAGAIQDNNSTSRPIQAYVVGDQVSTQQQLDRRISVAAKMGG